MRDHAIYHTEYFSTLTGLRGFAALWVFLYHLWGYAEPRRMMLEIGEYTLELTPLFSCGWAGVDFFFVLSAFLLSLPFAHWACGERAFPNAVTYMVKRVRRVFPAYWAQLAIVLALAATTTAYVFPSVTGLLTHLFMLLQLPPWWTMPLNGVWWTLPTEFLFYILLLPLALLLKTRTGRFVLAGLAAGAWLYRWWVFQNFADEGVGMMVMLMGNTLGCLDQFIVGTFLAYFYVRHFSLRNPRLPPALFLIAGVGGVLLVVYGIHWLYGFYWSGHPLLFLKNTLIGVSIASIMMACLMGSRVTRILLGNRAIIHCGIISYSIYLWHFPVVMFLSKWSFIADYPGYRLPLLMAFAVPLTWLLSYLSYRWVELPFLRRKKQPAQG
jgi:peptidoglycan/LPS O-acetylase OafA/YrhL